MYGVCMYVLTSTDPTTVYFVCLARIELDVVWSLVIRANHVTHVTYMSLPRRVRVQLRFSRHHRDHQRHRHHLHHLSKTSVTTCVVKHQP